MQIEIVSIVLEYEFKIHRVVMPTLSLAQSSAVLPARLLLDTKWSLTFVEPFFHFPFRSHETTFLCLISAGRCSLGLGLV